MKSLKLSFTFLFSTLFILSVVDKNAFNYHQKEDKTNFISPTVVNISDVDKTSSINYLYSYDDVCLSDNENVIRYSSSAPLDKFFKVENLSDSNIENGYFKIELLYIKLFDLMQIIVVEYNNDDYVNQNTFYGYPFFREDGNIDVKLDANGVNLFFSDYFDYETLEEKDSDGGHLPIIYDGGDYIPSIMHISYCVSDYNSDNLEGLAYSSFPQPNILTDGYLPYLYYRMKLDMAYSDFLINDALNNEIVNPNNENEVGVYDFINNQETTYLGLNWDNWRFGLDSLGMNANITNAGCECIAIFNMLFDCYMTYSDGARPHLPSIIALVQLCNADLLCGIFGASSIPSDVLNYIGLYASDAYVNYVEPLLYALVPTVSATILAICVGASGWLEAFMPGLTIFTAAAIEAILYEVITESGPFIAWYASHINDLSVPIELVIGTYTCVDKTSLPSFNTSMAYRLQGIVSFWNETDEYGNYLLIEKIHSVYVRRNGNYYSFYNLLCDGCRYDRFSIDLGIGLCNENMNHTSVFAANQFIKGYVMIG